METSNPTEESTVYGALIGALRAEADHNRSDTVPPAAVLWPDRERRWEAIIPRLREGLPLLTLGDYDPEGLTGPAIWLRCVIAGELEEVELGGETPVIYLPGVGRDDLRAVEDCPKELQPLAELQYRGTLFCHPKSRDWTPAAFLGEKLEIQVSRDSQTRVALARALPELMEEAVEKLRSQAPLQAADLDALLVPDPEREILIWLDDPQGYEKTRSPEVRAAFRSVCVARYGFDPESDGELEAAGRLVEPHGSWETVWQRYIESPRSYPNLPTLLDRANPTGEVTLFEESSPYRPRDNSAEEDRLRQELLGLAEATPPEARARIRELESEHGERRGWVWAGLGHSPLAQSLEPLSRLAEATGKPFGTGTPAEIARRYADGGWEADDLALRALAAAESEKDSAAVRAVVRAVYAEWLEETARSFQRAVEEKPLPLPECLDPDGPEPGRCILFTDGLRYDVAGRLAAMVEDGEAQVEMGWRFAGLPAITPTAKPALSPVCRILEPGADLGARINGSKVTAQNLRRAIQGRGYQILAEEETGFPDGSGWAEFGDLDRLGHDRGWRMALEIDRSLRRLAERVASLLEAGWREVVVVTDHGWLLLPQGLPRVDLPEHLTVVRKGRCARIAEGASTDHQTVPWALDPDISIAVATGISAYEAGKEYEHGGLSPQECVVPVLNVTPAHPVASATISRVKWTGLRCKITADDAPDGAQADLRTRAADPTSSIVEPKPVKERSATLFVEDDRREGEAAVVVVLGPDGRVLAQTTTLVGG